MAPKKSMKAQKQGQGVKPDAPKTEMKAMKAKRGMSDGEVDKLIGELDAIDRSYIFCQPSLFMQSIIVFDSLVVQAFKGIFEASRIMFEQTRVFGHTGSLNW